MKNEQLKERINNTMFMTGGNTDVEKNYFELGAYAGVEIMREWVLRVLNENCVAGLTDEDKNRTAQDILLETYEDLIVIFSGQPHAFTTPIRPVRSFSDLTDEECLIASGVVGGASHLSNDSQIHQFRELMKEGFYRQTNVPGNNWFKLQDYLTSINVGKVAAPIFPVVKEKKGFIVVWKDGTYKEVIETTYEFENDKDWLVTIPVTLSPAPTPNKQEQEGEVKEDKSLYEVKLCLTMMVRAFERIEKTKEQQKYFDDAKYILKKYFNLSDVLRNSTNLTNTDLVDYIYDFAWHWGRFYHLENADKIKAAVSELLQLPEEFLSTPPLPAADVDNMAEERYPLLTIDEWRQDDCEDYHTYATRILSNRTGFISGYQARTK